MKKFLSTVLLLLIFVQLIGCSAFGFNSQDLISPPKANLVQQAIHKLLQGDKSDITFVFPKTGEYRSAIIMKDLTGDGEDDAIGFFLDEESGVNVQFLLKTEHDWQIAATFKNAATQVDKVCFGDLNGDGIDDIIIGWGSAASLTATLCAYIKTENGFEEHSLNITYGEMTLTDFNEDSVKEIFTAEIFTVAENSDEQEDPPPPRANVFSFINGYPEIIYSTEVEKSVTKYSSINFGNISRDSLGLVLDGAKADNSIVTQVFYVNSITDRLVNAPLGVNNEKNVNSFSRPSSASILSRDINGDSIIEIPVVTPLYRPNEDSPLDSTSYLIDWSIYNPQRGIISQVETLMNTSEGYWFPLPKIFKNKIMAINDTNTRSVTYSEVIIDNVSDKEDEEPNITTGGILFKIRVFPRSVWNQNGDNGGYELLSEQEDTVYGIFVFTKNENYLYGIERIKTGFTVNTD